MFLCVMAQKINARSVRHHLWHQSAWAYYTSTPMSSVAWTQCLKHVMVFHTALGNWKRFRALKAPSRAQRKKTCLSYLNHWLRVLPYSQWYHHYSYKWGSNPWQRQLNPIKARYRARQARSLAGTAVRNRRGSS